MLQIVWRDYIQPHSLASLTLSIILLYDSSVDGTVIKKFKVQIRAYQNFQKIDCKKWTRTSLLVHFYLRWIFCNHFQVLVNHTYRTIILITILRLSRSQYRKDRMQKQSSKTKLYVVKTQGGLQANQDVHQMTLINNFCLSSVFLDFTDIMD